MKYIVLATLLAFAQTAIAPTAQAKCMGPAWKCPVTKHQQDRKKPKVKPGMVKKSNAAEW